MYMYTDIYMYNVWYVPLLLFVYNLSFPLGKAKLHVYLQTCLRMKPLKFSYTRSL